MQGQGVDRPTQCHAGKTRATSMRQMKNLLAFEDLQLLTAIGANGALTGAARKLQLEDTLVPLITPIFAGLRAEHPEITIELMVSNAFFSLTKRDADIAVRPAAAAPDNFVGRRLAALATAPYAATAYLAGKRRHSALLEHDWLGFDGSLQHLASAKWVSARAEAERIVYRASSLLALKTAADAGMGVAALPCYLGDSDCTLERVHPPLKELEDSLWLLTHPDLRRVARIRTVLDFLAGAFAKRRDLIEGRGYSMRGGSANPKARRSVGD